MSSFLLLLMTMMVAVSNAWQYQYELVTDGGTCSNVTQIEKLETTLVNCMNSMGNCVTKDGITGDLADPVAFAAYMSARRNLRGDAQVGVEAVYDQDVRRLGVCDGCSSNQRTKEYCQAMGCSGGSRRRMKQTVLANGNTICDVIENIRNNCQADFKILAEDWGCMGNPENIRFNLTMVTSCD